MGRKCYITEEQYNKLLSALLSESLNIDRIDEKELSECYKDYKERIIFKKPLNILFLEDWESRMITWEVEKAIKEIKQKYSLHDWQIYKANAENNVGIIVCIADIGDNVADMKQDMEKLGYHLGCETQKADNNGRNWQYMQFEPIYSGDCTDYIKGNCLLLFHWTPSANIEAIKKEGIVPKPDSNVFSYPERVYLFTDKNNFQKLKLLGLLFSKLDKQESINDEIEYSLLFISVNKLPKDMHFFYDPNMEKAVYTEQTIPSYSIIKNFKINF